MSKQFDPAIINKSAPFKAAELTKQQRDEWDMTRTKFLVSCPAFAHILYTMMSPRGEGNVAYFTKDVPIAATDGVNLLLNPDTFFKYDRNERVFIIAHEVMHCIFNHCGLGHAWRKRNKVSFTDGTSLPYEHQLMNVAMDLVINDLLIESKVGKFNKDWLHDTKYGTQNDAAVDVYRKVYKQAEKNGKGKGGGQGPQGQQFDEHLSPGQGEGKDADTAAGERNEQQWKSEVAAAAASAKAQGKLPAGLERFLNEVLESQVSWQEHIQALFNRRVGSGGYNWDRPDRRMAVRSQSGLGQSVYAPGRSGHGAECVVVAVDTSGSIGDREVNMFFGEMAGILEDVRPRRLVILWCDAHVHRVDEAEDSSDLNHLRAKGAPGGGGTAFEPVFHQVQQLGLTPDALVYLTDGYGSFPNDAPSYPVIWGSIALDKYPWGDVVMIPKVAA